MSTARWGAAALPRAACAAAAAASRRPRRLGAPRRGLPSGSATEMSPRTPSPSPSPSQQHTPDAGAERRSLRPTPPELVEVPSLPFVGSLLPRYSSTPNVSVSRDTLAFLRGMRERFGDFYLCGLPGLGVGVRSLVYVLNDPDEYAKVLRSEGRYPSGAVNHQWPIKKFLREGLESPIATGDEGGGFYGRGEEWRRLRTFLQMDMLSPEAAKEYAPAVLQVAEAASKLAPSAAAAGQMDSYLNDCSFDMFNAVMMGSSLGMANRMSGNDADPIDLEFCRASCVALRENLLIKRDPKENFLAAVGWKTKRYREFCRNFKVARKISNEKIQQFRDRFFAGSLSNVEETSYLARAIRRQICEDSVVSFEEMTDLVIISLMAGIDTTAAVVSWNILQLAYNPEAQEKLHGELASHAVEGEGHECGRLNASALGRSASPYLHACVRETHRLTPATPVNLIKGVGSPGTVLHGANIPVGSAVLFDSYSIGMDPELVQDPEQFRPERWLSDAVAERTGTPAAALDHPFFRAPFSQGARRCPGSRIASVEAAAMLSQLVLDWRMSVAGGGSARDLKCVFLTMLQPRWPTIVFEPRET